MTRSSSDQCMDLRTREDDKVIRSVYLPQDQGGSQDLHQVSVGPQDQGGGEGLQQVSVWTSGPSRRTRSSSRQFMILRRTTVQCWTHSESNFNTFCISLESTPRAMYHVKINGPYLSFQICIELFSYQLFPSYSNIFMKCFFCVSVCVFVCFILAKIKSLPV